MDGREKVILLVEDEFLIALSESRIIRGFDYRVLFARSGEEAVELASTDGEIDLVLMDINLGEGIDGREAARRILSKRNLPIVFLSSHAEASYVESAKRISPYGYVLKSSDNLSLREAIESALRSFESSR
jgi:CheY-like chemotaxis protein